MAEPLSQDTAVETVSAEQTRRAKIEAVLAQLRGVAMVPGSSARDADASRQVIEGAFGIDDPEYAILLSMTQGKVTELQAVEQMNIADQVRQQKSETLTTGGTAAFAATGTDASVAVSAASSETTMAPGQTNVVAAGAAADNSGAIAGSINLTATTPPGTENTPTIQVDASGAVADKSTGTAFAGAVNADAPPSTIPIGPRPDKAEVLAKFGATPGGNARGAA